MLHQGCQVVKDATATYNVTDDFHHLFDNDGDLMVSQHACHGLEVWWPHEPAVQTVDGAVALRQCLQ